jgi:integrase
MVCMLCGTSSLRGVFNPKRDGGRELPPKVVQHLLGHSSIVMTLDRYGHLFPSGDDRTELSNAVKALLGRSKPIPA